MSDQEPVAWAVVSDSTEEIDCEFVYPDPSTAGDVALDINGGVVPLYRSPTLTDEEREAVEWYAAYGAGHHADTLRKLLERNDHDAVPDAIANADGEPAPKCGGEAGLSSRDGTGNTHTLTEAEHDALEFAVETGRVAMHDDATLRKLLERLK